MAIHPLKLTYNPTDMPPLSNLSISSGQCNRGAAVGSGKVFVARLDANLIAIDAASGAEVWRATVDRWQDGYTETMAPLYVNGMVIVGTSGGEFYAVVTSRLTTPIPAVRSGVSIRSRRRESRATKPGPGLPGAPAELPCGRRRLLISNSDCFMSPRASPRPTRTGRSGPGTICIRIPSLP